MKRFIKGDIVNEGIDEFKDIYLSNSLIFN